MSTAFAPSDRIETSPGALRVLIADPETASTRRLRTLLTALPGVQVVAECQDGVAAVRTAETLEPDLVMIDLHLPGIDGLGVAEQLAGPQGPAVVFMARADRFDPRALEFHALDHILKPIDALRLETTIHRAFLLVADEGRGLTRSPALPSTRLHPPSLDRLAVRTGSQIVLHNLADVDWIEAAGNYSRIHIGERCVVIRRTIGELEAALDPDRFLRVHRSTIVSLARIRALEPVFKGEFVVILRDGTRLTSSRSYRSNIQRLLSLCG
jgi:two-component system, LytTR family, response regulator